MSALVLSILNCDMTDAFGNRYPEEGFVKHDKFISDTNIQAGLHGILWGETGGCSYLKDHPKSVWVVVKIDSDHNIITLDDLHNIVKFPEGLVVHVGDKRSCGKYIVEYKRKNSILDVGNTAGQILEAILPNIHAIVHGFHGKAISDIAGLHAISTALKSRSITYRPVSNAICLGNGGKSAALEDDSHAICFGTDSMAQTCGSRSISLVCGSGSRAISTGRDSLAICLADGCEACAGPGGIILMIYEFEGIKRLSISYAGSMILSNRIYYCNERGRLVLVG